jgi:hypothetical protein
VEGVAGSHCQLRQVAGRAVLLLWSVLVVGELCPHTRVAFCGKGDAQRACSACLSASATLVETTTLTVRECEQPTSRRSAWRGAPA